MFYKRYKKILSPANGMNIFRGCSHGCIYCDSRSDCYQINHAFENIEVKLDAPFQLEQELASKRKPVMIGTGAMTDPYIHLESKLLYTRKCLEVIHKFHCGVSILTKSNRIFRDLDILEKINLDAKAVVQMTLTTADDELCKTIEPNVSVTSERVDVLKECKKRGIPTVVWLCPFLPFINDTEENLLKLLDYCEEAGVYGIIFFGIGLTLRSGNREYFYKKLDEHFPGLKERYIKTYGDAYEVISPNNASLSELVVTECKKRGILIGNDKVFNYLRHYSLKSEQLSLF